MLLIHIVQEDIRAVQAPLERLTKNTRHLYAITWGNVKNFLQKL